MGGCRARRRTEEQMRRNRIRDADERKDLGRERADEKKWTLAGQTAGAKK
jgi:hypothetical protein